MKRRAPRAPVSDPANRAARRKVSVGRNRGDDHLAHCTEILRPGASDGRYNQWKSSRCRPAARSAIVNILTQLKAVGRTRKQKSFGKLPPVSLLALGGGGLGMVW